MNRYLLFAIIAIAAAAVDLGTKKVAEDSLASVTRRWDHPIERTVRLDGRDQATLAEWLDTEFGEGTASAQPPLVHGVFIVRDEGAVEGPLRNERIVRAGDRVRISHRQVTIVPGFWNHVYVQNFGAAWGFLSNKDERFVRPFFLIVALIAIFVVFGIYRTVREDQWALKIALPLIVGGALGNFVDRARYGYVVDFVDWYVTVGGQERHWPTFNVADVWITIGVTLMILEILFGRTEEAPESKGAAPIDDTVEPAV